MIQSRDELIYALTEAAELEHALCCQYLFAAFSLKQGVDEGVSWHQLNHIQNWEQTILIIGRQEMGHLALVNNLLIAIGGAPHFRVPNFPQPAKYYPLPLELAVLTEATVKRFICFERPPEINEHDAFCLEEEHPVKPDAPPTDLSPYPIAYTSINDLYRQIREAFAELDTSELFIGPPDGQITPGDLNLSFPQFGSEGGVFDVFLLPVTDRASAITAIDLIIEEGEGEAGEADDPDSHYGRLLKILADYQALVNDDPGFNPTRAVVSNPHLFEHPDMHGGTQITNADARAVMDMFNMAYETLLLLLLRFFARTDENVAEIGALRYTLFPMMTMVLRPLAETITAMPAFDDEDEQRAGPSFETYRTLSLLPHKQSAWIYLTERIHRLRDRAEELSQNPQMPERLTDIHFNLMMLSRRFDKLILTRGQDT